jgi:hypothetical protein
MEGKLESTLAEEAFHDMSKGTKEEFQSVNSYPIHTEAETDMNRERSVDSKSMMAVNDTKLLDTNRDGLNLINQDPEHTQSKGKSLKLQKKKKKHSESKQKLNTSKTTKKKKTIDANNKDNAEAPAYIPPKLVLCTLQCRYRVVKKVCKQLDYKLIEDDTVDWDLYWSDTSIPLTRIQKM